MGFVFRYISVCSLLLFVNKVSAQLNVFAELLGNPVVTTGWALNGDCFVYNDEVVLAPNLNDHAGSIFYTTPIDFSDGGKFVVDFEFRMYDGNAADGIALNIITQLPQGSMGGGGIGVSTQSEGLKIIFDTYDNCSQYDNPEIQVFNGIGYHECIIPMSHKVTHQSYLRSPNYQSARFIYDNGTVKVYVNCILRLTVQNVVIQNSGYFGFSAATGGQRDRHSIKGLKIYAQTPMVNTKNSCSDDALAIGVSPQVNNTYLWEAVSTSDDITLLSDPTSANPTFSMTNDGNEVLEQRYLFKTTIASNGSGSCAITSVDTIKIKVYPNPKIEDIKTKLICESNTITATATTTGGIAPHNYSWSTIGDSSLISTSLVASNLLSGTYLFTVISEKQCKDSQTVLVVVPEKLSLNLTTSKDTICAGDSTLVTIQHMGGTNPIQLSWLGTSTLNEVVNLSFWAKPLTDSTYSMVAVDSNGCTDTAKLTLKAVPIPVANFEASYISGCIPFVTQLKNLSSGAFASSHYIFSDGRQLFTSASSHETVTFPIAGCYDVSLILTTAEGCSDTMLRSDYLCAYPNPVASFHVSPHELTSEERDVHTENLSQGAQLYFWDFGDNTPMNEQFAPTHSYPSDHVGVFSITLVVVSDQGCSDTATQTVSMQDMQQVYVPNTFSPNNDSYNELFLPIITADIAITEYRLTIFDRWGERVFETDDIQKAWDGTQQGKIVPDGVYVWKILIEGRNSADRKNYIGHVHLIR